MATFADIQEVAEDDIRSFAGGSTPAGHFGANTKVLGNNVSYLLEGEKDDPEAVVKGRVVMTVEDGQLIATAYSKGGVTGGEYLERVQDYRDTLAKMV
jgi:hypothetical protein